MLVFMKLFLLFILVLCIVISNILNKLCDGVEINVDKFCVLWLLIWFVDFNIILFLMYLRILFFFVFEILVICIELLFFGSFYLVKVIVSLFIIYFF